MKPLDDRRNQNHAVLERTVAQFWRGDARATHDALERDGYNISYSTVSRISKHVRFPDRVKEVLDKKPGVASRHELQEFLTAVMRGEITDGVDWIDVYEKVGPLEDDYDPIEGGDQFRKVKKSVPRAAKLSDRLKASELFGRTICAFTDQVQINGEVKFTMSALLDDDLKKVLPAHEIKPVEELKAASLPPVTAFEDLIG